jgi:hypothetical protein
MNHFAMRSGVVNKPALDFPYQRHAMKGPTI